MRMPSKLHVPLLRRAPVWLCAVFLVLTCPMATGDWEYDAYTPITDVTMTSPGANEVWLAGSDHALTCTTSTDMDRKRPCPESPWEDAPDSVSHYWTGTGTFQDNDNIGTSVTYICTNTAGNNTVTVYADDDYASDNNTAVVGETAKSDTETVSVVIPTLSEITYGGSKHTISDVTEPEYTSSPAKNEPAAYSISVDDMAASVKLATSAALTEGSSIDLLGETDAGMVLDDWDGSGTLSATNDTVSCTNFHRMDSVCKIEYDTDWKYKVATGSDTYIDIDTQSGHVIYLTLGTPVRAENKIVFEYSCNYCSGMKTATTVCEAVLAGIAGAYTYNWDCYQLSSNFDRLVGIQAVAATQEKWACKFTGHAVDDMKLMKSTAIDPIPAGAGGGGSDQYTWWYHQWSSVLGKTWDPSSNTVRDGGWTDYEDFVFADYDRVTVVSPLTSVWIGSNPGGQTSDHQDTITHSSPAPDAFTEP